MELKTDIQKGKKRAKIWFLINLVLFAYGGIMLGIGIFRVRSGDDGGYANMIGGLFCLGACGFLAYKMCCIIADYASMEKDLERIEEQKKICEELEEMHRKITGEE